MACIAGTPTTRQLAFQRRLTTVDIVNALLLLSAVWAMVFKPTL
jgi:hypothetical protein